MAEVAPLDADMLALDALLPAPAITEEALAVA
jgi:hypothetical protein